MSGTADLFSWLDAIWTKAKPEGAFPAYIAHRFLASDRFWANAARVIGKDVRDPAMAFAVWQGITAEDAGAPRLAYPAAKKRPGAEQLTLRMMAVLGVRRAVAEDMQKLVALAGRFRTEALDDLYKEFGVEQPGTEVEEREEDDAPRKKGPVGLMAMLK